MSPVWAISLKCKDFNADRMLRAMNLCLVSRVLLDLMPLEHRCRDALRLDMEVSRCGDELPDVHIAFELFQESLLTLQANPRRAFLV